MTQPSVQINPTLSQSIRDFLQATSYTQIGVLVDTNTKISCYPLIQNSLPSHSILEISPGEEHKNLATCQQVWKQLTKLNFDRHSLLIIVGGGVLGDLGGFCAATYKRGIDFVLIPTTLLAQVDASIGGKLGIDFMDFKNHIGLFKNPVSTLIHPAFVATLPERELRSGFAEVIKHCLIADKVMWKEISLKELKSQDWETLITHSVRIKQHITDQDPQEKGIRKVLNFGHTLGHALETYFLSAERRIFHGEAIAMGMIIESFIAERKGLLDKAELSAIQNYLVLIYGKPKEKFDIQRVLELTIQDKKNKGSKVLLAVPNKIGQAIWDVEASEGEMMEALEYYKSI